MILTEKDLVTEILQISKQKDQFSELRTTKYALREICDSLSIIDLEG
jgi:hypothetical protein